MSQIEAVTFASTTQTLSIIHIAYPSPSLLEFREPKLIPIPHYPQKFPSLDTRQCRMSGLDSWEDDPAAQDENLSKQTQQNLNLNGQARSFQPNAQSFQPNAQSFQPGQQYQQYGGGGYNQYGQYYQQQPYGGNYAQYGQQGYNQGYNQGYGQGYQQQNIYDPNYSQQYQNYQQPQQPQSQQQPQRTPVIAKRPQADDAKSAPPSAPAELKKDATAAPKTMVLSIGGDASTPSKAKDTAPPKTKVLSIGSTSTPKKEEKKEEAGITPAEAGAKVNAAKAIEKTESKKESKGKTSAPSSGKSSPSPADTRDTKDADAVAKEQAADVSEDILEEVYGKEHVNIIFIGRK